MDTNIDMHTHSHILIHTHIHVYVHVYIYIYIPLSSIAFKQVSINLCPAGVILVTTFNNKIYVYY